MTIERKGMWSGEIQADGLLVVLERRLEAHGRLCASVVAGYTSLPVKDILAAFKTLVSTGKANWSDKESIRK